MIERSFGKYTTAFGLSFVVISIVNALLVIAKQENAALKEWMKASLGHHWITHGVIVIAAFLVLGVVFAWLRTGDQRLSAGHNLAIAIAAFTVIGGLIIAGYFLGYG